MRVQVAIDLALDRLFDYEVPEALQEKLAVGQLLSVPFGHREARGFAMAVESTALDGSRRQSMAIESTALDGNRRQSSAIESTAVDGCRRQSSAVESTALDGSRRQSRAIEKSKAISLKPVSAIVDETPFFSPALLELVRRVAAYTAAPLESVLKAALPAAVLKRNAHAREQLFVEPAVLASLSPLSPLASDAGGRQESREGLERQEAKRQERREGPESQEGQALTKRQRWLHEQIVRLGGGWMTQLCAELKTTPASLRTLAEKGLVAIGAKARRRNPLEGGRILPSKPLTLNAEQAAALEAICGGALPSRSPLAPEAKARHEGQEGQEGREGQETKQSNNPPLLLFGVTGSGKTEVYLQAIAAELAAGRSAIVLVPEISLTPQTVRRFASRFGDRVAVLHSALSDGERYDEWHRIRSGAARVVVGPRSAVWAPVANLGLVVVDEEHDASYKQGENPRYHARDVAVLRGRIEGARVVLGSATPSLESWANVAKGKYVLAEMRERAGAGTLPAVRLVEMSDGAIFSRDLLDAVRLRLDRHEQTILFLNRRGFSRAYACSACGAAVECPACGVAYVYHRADDCLRCHVCGGWIPLPRKCPACGGASFDCRGVGTQRAEDALAKCFPRARIIRMDADSVSRKNSHDDLLSAFRRGEADVLLGTQMIAKGLDFPNVTLVGVLNADASLNMPDFRSGERAFQLLAQVAGRAGRAELPGEVLIQSHDVSSPVLSAVVRGSFASFAVGELAARRECFFPPFCHLAVVGLRSRDVKLVSNWAAMYAKSLKNYFSSAARPSTTNHQPSADTLVSDAVPCALERADGWYRWQIVLRSVSAAAIVRAWRWIVSARPAPSGLRVSLDVDAFDVL